MHLFCIVKEMRAMDFLIASGSGGDGKGWTALYTAALGGHAAVVKGFDAGP